MLIGLHLTVSEVCQYENLDMRSDYSLGDFNKQKFENKSFLKKSSQKEFFFFDSELPYKTRTGLFIAFSLLGLQYCFIFWREI